MDQIPPEVWTALTAVLTAIAGWIAAKKTGRHRRTATLDDGYKQLSEIIPSKVLLRLMARQHGQCAISGLPVTADTATIDRIYGKPGYYENGAVRIVDREVKRAKGDLPDGKFKAICERVAAASKEEKTDVDKIDSVSDFDTERKPGSNGTMS